MIWNLHAMRLDRVCWVQWSMIVLFCGAALYAVLGLFACCLLPGKEMTKMKILQKIKSFFNFSKANQPVYFVEPGETFWVETDDCYSGQIKTETVLRPDIDISIMDCSVGPIAVSGAEPGDVLCVEVLAIQLAEAGGDGYISRFGSAG